MRRGATDLVSSTPAAHHLTYFGRIYENEARDASNRTFDGHGITPEPHTRKERVLDPKPNQNLGMV